MERLSKFSRLPTTEQRLLIKAALLVEAIKLGMRLLPFRTLRRLLARAADAPLGVGQAKHGTSAERVAWAVGVASRHTPGIKTCLAQALAAQVLLARRGHPALVRIGVVRGDRERFEAHAWVESEGRVLLGGSGLERFTPLTVWKTEA